MYSILDIDLDYFNALTDSARRLEELLDWAGCPVSVVVERHNHAFARWRRLLGGRNTSPSHILHVDEHHDMMDERKLPNMANFIYHVMRTWPRCQVHWLVQYPIDCPSMWLDQETWSCLRHRFSRGPNRPANWPRPDLVSVCTSPEFVDRKTRSTLLGVLDRYRKPSRGQGIGRRTTPRSEP